MTAQAVEAPETLPPVSGRHRNRALAAARKQRAIELRTQGLTYQAIADAMGYANAGSVYTIVKNAQAQQLTETVEVHRSSELARLHDLLAALWPKAMAGDPAAVMASLRCLDMRWRLLGLEESTQAKRSKAHWDSCQGPATVVVREDDCRHVGCRHHGRFGDPTGS